MPVLIRRGNKSRQRRRLDKANRINNLLEAKREGLTIPQLRAKRRVDRTKRLAEARKRRKALVDDMVDDVSKKMSYVHPIDLNPG